MKRSFRKIAVFSSRVVGIAAVAAALAAVPAMAAQPPGKPASFCGNGAVEKNEQCDQNNLNGQTCESLGNDAGTLSCGANCQLDTSQCISAECGNGVQGPGEECEAGTPAASCGDLGEGFGTAECGPGCTFDTSTCSVNRFVDNGDGTVSDFDKGLMWEKKVAGSSSANDVVGVGNCLHCVDDGYHWGAAMAEWASAVNGRTDSSISQTGFAGHTDWRLPTNVELQTILDCSSGPPCIDPIFVFTKSSVYWSASTWVLDPGRAWNVNFSDGDVRVDVKANTFHVRAVRTGP